MKLSLVIPAHNEAANLGPCLNRVREELARCAGAHEVVFVDDGSSDGTWSEIQAHVERSRGTEVGVSGVRLSRNFGKEAAISAGLRQARGEAVVVMDADLQHPPELIPKMFEIWSRGEALVVEARKRHRQGESWLRRIAARFFYRAFRVGSGLDMDNSSDFKLLDRRAVDEYLRLGENRRFFRGLTTWLGFPTAVLEMDPPERQRGTSSWKIGDLLEMARQTIISFSSLPLRLISWIGILGLLFSFGLTIQTLWYHFAGMAEEGFPTVIILILAMGSAILLALGLIGEYVASIYEEVKGRPQYVVLDTAEPDEPPR